MCHFRTTKFALIWLKKCQPKCDTNVWRKVHHFAFTIILDLFISPSKTSAINEISPVIRYNCMHWLNFVFVLLFDFSMFSIFQCLFLLSCVLFRPLPFRVVSFPLFYVGFWYSRSLTFRLSPSPDHLCLWPFLPPLLSALLCHHLHHRLQIFFATASQPSDKLHCRMFASPLTFWLDVLLCHVYVHRLSFLADCRLLSRDLSCYPPLLLPSLPAFPPSGPALSFAITFVSVL